MHNLRFEVEWFQNRYEILVVPSKKTFLEVV